MLNWLVQDVWLINKNTHSRQSLWHTATTCAGFHCVWDTQTALWVIRFYEKFKIFVGTVNVYECASKAMSKA